MVREEKKSLSQILDSKQEIDLVLSYSKLSDFDRNGAVSLVRKTNVDNDGAKLGSVVDDLLFNDKEYFKKNYYIVDGDKPGATLGVLTDIIIKNYKETPTKEEILKIIAKNGFWYNTKKENLLIDNFDKPDFWNYLKGTFEAKGRKIVTSSEYQYAIELVTILKEHKYSKHILENDFENIYQLKFEIKYKKFKLRGIIDITTIDHKNKKVFMTDLKTGKNPSIEFQESYIKWRYYFQGAIYSLAFKEICEVLGLEGYTLEPFQFLYISKSDKIPLLYKMTKKWIKASFEGFYINSYKYKGINELLDEIYWCWKNKEYNIPKYIVEHNGEVELNDKFIRLDE